MRSYFYLMHQSQSNMRRLLSGLLFLLVPFFNAFSEKDTIGSKASMVVEMAKKYHYSPRTLNDEFSEIVFHQFIDLVDEERELLTVNDFKELEVYKYQIDSFVFAQKSDLVTATNGILIQRVDELIDIISHFQSDKTNWNLNDSIVILKHPQFKTISDLKMEWNLQFKLSALAYYVGDSLNKDRPFSVERIEEKRSQALMRQLKRLNRLKEQLSNTTYLGKLYLQALSQSFDPHTTYFSELDQQLFSNQLSKESLSFGIELSRNEFGETEIYEVIPGGPAWNSNAINEEDIILKVAVKEGEEVDFETAPSEQILKILLAQEIKEATFTIRKKSSVVKEVELCKAKIEVEENVVQGFVLDGEHKVGYIYLPSFYTNMGANMYSAFGCANDVAKELIKLKREGIEALIFDVRNNGGGAITEALQLAGMFINYGALTIVDDSDGDAYVMKDMNRGTVFDAPMVVMQNYFSASASELFAAAMQDYNRALIVGSPSYGKSTSQVVMPLHHPGQKELNEVMKEEVTDFIKLTTGKFYRVNGKSHQKSGVLPDVILPNLYDSVEVGEKVFSTALDTSHIAKKAYYYPVSALPVEQLRAQSLERINKDSIFMNVKANAQEYAQNKDRMVIPLSYTAFKAFYKDIENHELESDSTKTTFKVSNPKYLRGMSSVADSTKRVNEALMKSIVVDSEIQEAYAIVKDLIEIKKK